MCGRTNKTMWWMLNFIEWSFLGHFFYLLGSILWVASPSLCWLLRGDILCNYVEFAASICFIFDGTFSLVEYFVINEYYSALGGYPHIFGGGSGLSSIERRLERVNWYLLVQLFFFYGAPDLFYSFSTIGALADILVGSVESFVDSTIDAKKTVFIVDMSSSFLWTLSGLFGLVIWHFDKKAREIYGSNLQFRLFPFLASEEEQEKSHVWLDVEGWAYWIFFLGNLQYAFGAYTCYSYDNTFFCWLPELTAGIFFIFEWMFLFWDFLRRRKYSHIEEIDEQDSVKHWLIQHRLLEEIQKNEECKDILDGRFTEDDVFQHVRKHLEDDEVLDLNLTAMETQQLFEDMSNLVERVVERQLDEYANEHDEGLPNFVPERHLQASTKYEDL